jgi:GNAT superfamily N-acetyltransferase
MYTIKLIDTDKLNNIIPLLRVLNEKIDEDTLKQRLEDMIRQGYQCIGIYDQETLAGISGMWFLTKYYVGKHIEPDNVIILPQYRGKGLGEQLMKWIYEYARSQGCIASELNCYVNNHGGQKFWINEGYRVIGFHYQKMLT